MCIYLEIRYEVVNPALKRKKHKITKVDVSHVFIAFKDP